MPPTLIGADTGEPALAAAIAATPGWDRAETVRSSTLSAGITNRNYLLESGDEQIVVRVFGDFVFEHLLNTAVQEQIIFDNLCVTDWELQRYFERG